MPIQTVYVYLATVQCSFLWKGWGTSVGHSADQRSSLGHLDHFYSEEQNRHWKKCKNLHLQDSLQLVTAISSHL